MKKSFILYYDSLSVIDKMSDEQVGKLLRLMRSYHNGKDYRCDDFAIDLVFEQFKNQFDRDIIAYDNICKKNKDIAEARWNKIKKKSTKSTNRTFTIPESTKSTHNDNDNDNDNEKDIYNNKIKGVKEIFITEGYLESDLDFQALICYEHYKGKRENKIPSTQYSNWIKKSIEYGKLSKPKKKMEYATLDD